MEETTFTRGPARRPLQVGTDPILQWATGLQTKERRIYAGWLAEAGKHDEFDDAMNAAGFAQVTIKHGTGNFVTHWAIETATLFVLADGVQSIGEMKHTSERYGVAFGWRTLEGGRQQSALKVRVHLREVLAAGFDQPLTLTAKGTVTGDLIAAFTRQFEVLDALDAFRKLDQKPPANAPFYAFSIPIGPGDEVSRGSGSQTKEISPPQAKLPAPITKAYMTEHWVPSAWLPFIEPRINEAVRWSAAMSKMIAIGAEQGEPDY